MKPFGGRRRADGARPRRGARPATPSRPPEAALGRATRGLVGPARGRPKQSGTPRLPSLPSLPRLPSLGGHDRATGRSAGRGRPGGLARVGRIVTPGRAAGLLGMLSAGFLLGFVTGPTAFALGRTELPELTWTDQGTVTSALGLQPGTNVFRLDTEPLVAAIEALPAVASADVRVALPEGDVIVSIQEREAILAWEAGDTRYLADRDGVVFATLAADAALPSGVAVVEDRRLAATGSLAIGDRLDPVDLDVATRLGSLTPADVGSAASRLRVRITESDGFVLVVDRGWTAVFGYYSPATRPTDMIPDQVRLLRSLLYGREETVQRVILASGTDGTFVPKPTPKPTPKK